MRSINKINNWQINYFVFKYNELHFRPERDQFKGEPGELIICKLDLCSLASVRECARTLNDTEPNIHILINNAGVMMCPFSKTIDGYETQFQSNHLGHFLLTLLLLPKLRNSTPARIVNVSSMAHSGKIACLWVFICHRNDTNWDVQANGSIYRWEIKKKQTNKHKYN